MIEIDRVEFIQRSNRTEVRAYYELDGNEQWAGYFVDPFDVHNLGIIAIAEHVARRIAISITNETRTPDDLDELSLILEDMIEEGLE